MSFCETIESYLWHEFQVITVIWMKILSKLVSELKYVEIISFELRCTITTSCQGAFQFSKPANYVVL